MPRPRVSKTTAKRSKKRQATSDSSDESFTEPASVVPVEEDTADNVIKDSSSGLENMTEEEIAQHLKLCMKLSAENKINMKNAFGLHLIDIMQRMVKNTERADIQQASLSLQASSKIYAGRVEALYQETCRFHGHLQSIVSGGKKEKRPTESNDDFDDGGMADEDDDHQQDRRKSRSQKKSKSFLKSEDSLKMETEVNALSTGEPHGNFVTINSAFCTSRLAPKLLSSLRIVDDSCMLRCAIPEPCFKPKNPIKSELFVVPPKFETSLQKIKNLNISNSNFQALLASTEINLTPQMSTPKPAAPPLCFNDDEDPIDTGFPDMDDSMMPPPPAPPAEEEKSIDTTTARLDVLNITVDAFVNDIASAITNDGVDTNLLPPNSALKKMLDKSARKSIKPSVEKSTRKKIKEPFFCERSTDNIKQVFIKGRQTSVSQKLLSEWSIEHTSCIDSCFKFIDELYADNVDSENSFRKTEPTQVLDFLNQDDCHYYFKSNFLKESQMWKVSRRKLCLDLSFNVPSFPDQTERRLGSMAPNDPEGLAVSFQDMSLHDSLHNDSILDVPDVGGDPEVSFHVDDSEEPQYLITPEAFETDIEELMVKKPELVRPTSVKFSEKPVNLNTEKIKQLLWDIINKRLKGSGNLNENSSPQLLFSDVYEELKLQLKREISESISMQFAFVVLLILANQKTLLIENFEGDKDLCIKQDISECDVSLNAL